MYDEDRFNARLIQFNYKVATSISWFKRLKIANLSEILDMSHMM